MQFVQPDPTRLWLVGGGLSTPWTYADLASASAVPQGADAPVGGAEVLVRLTRALRAGEIIDLGEPTFSGEGAPPRVSPLAGEEMSDWTFRPEARLILRTSGSTGSSSIVRQRASVLWRSTVVHSRHRDDVWGLAFNPTHIAGVQVYLQAIANGNTIVNLWGLPQAEIVQRCMKWRVTHLSATPTFYRLLLALAKSLSDVRSISIGGERADPALIQQLKTHFAGAKVRNIYASTEAGTLFVGESDELEVPADLAGLVRTTAGRLWLHRSLLADETTPEEWHDTGDVIEVTSDAPLRFRIVGRVQGWINIGGEKVNPCEVEDVLISHPAIVAARVHGRKNSVTGQILAADIVPRETPPSQQMLDSFLRERLPAHKHPRIIRFVDTLELTRTGKVRRHE